MRKRSWIALVGVLALTLGGCGGEEDTATTSPSPDAATPAPTAPASPAPATPSPKAPGAVKPGAKPVVVAKATAPGLIQSTPATQRLTQLKKGRKDPFATLPGIVATRVVQPKPPGSETTVKKPTTQIKPLPNVRPAGSGRPGGTLPGGSSPVAIAPPPPPDPVAAKAVVVTGVVTIGNQPMIILKAPDEPTSRYVTVGQTLSNGEVRVKRIDESADGPVVILEQYGVEVSKAVGEQPTAPSTGAGQPPV